ncbi:MAG: hypothetical protein ACE5ES_03120 [Candidatus Nanoarchaeia archaeon]
MSKYHALIQYFEKTLDLIILLKGKSILLEEKVDLIRNISSDEDAYDAFMNILNELKNNTKSLEKKLSELAFQITSDDEELIEILDVLYLNKYDSIDYYNI